MRLRRVYAKDGATGAGAPGGGGGAGGGTTVPAKHALVGDRHTASGLTVGQVLKAIAADAFGFAALAWSELSGKPAILDALGELDDDDGVLTNDGDGNLSWEAAGAGGEPALGNPDADGQVLSSLMDGTRSWVDQGGGSSPVQRLTLDGSAFTLTSYSANCFKLATPLTVGDGHAIHIVAQIRRDTTGHPFCLAVSSDNFATYIAFSFNTDGNRVNYAYYSGSLHVVSNNAYGAVVTGTHVLDIWVYVNSVANGGIGAYWMAKCRNDPSPLSTAIPALASYTNVALDGANFQIAVCPPNVLADLKALDVEIL